jgi:hypothetical protein
LSKNNKVHFLLFQKPLVFDKKCQVLPKSEAYQKNDVFLKGEDNHRCERGVGATFGFLKAYASFFNRLRLRRRRLKK